jgi:hypothetical protein
MEQEQSEDDFVWVDGGEGLLRIVGTESKSQAIDIPSGAELSPQALISAIEQLNARQNGHAPDDEVEPFTKENQFVQLILTIEGEKLSKELFSLLFDIVGFQLSKPALSSSNH